MKRIFLYILFLPLLFVSVSCNEEPDIENKTIDLQYLCNRWSLVKYETSTPGGSGAIVVTTSLDGSMCFTFNADETVAITSNEQPQAMGTYVVNETQNSLELTEYAFVEGVEPEGIALVMLPIVACNTLQIEELTQENFTVSMPYSGDTRFIAYFISQ